MYILDGYLDLWIAAAAALFSLAVLAIGWLAGRPRSTDREPR